MAGDSFLVKIRHDFYEARFIMPDWISLFPASSQSACWRYVASTGPARFVACGVHEGRSN